MPTLTQHLKTATKQALYHLLPKTDGYSDLRVRGGLAKDSILRLDVRVEGSYWLGTYDNWVFNLVPLKKYLRPGMVAWDCGSYVGYYAAVFRHLVGVAGEVHAFEASLTNYDRVQHVPELNHWDNVHVHYLAVGPDHTKLQFVNNGGGMAGPYGLVKTFPNFGTLDISTVECTGVDEMVYERGLPAPDFIKFDLECAEEYALLNGDRVFREKRPVLLLEVHGQAAMKATGQFLERYGYSARPLGTVAAVQTAAECAGLTDEWYMMLCTPGDHARTAPSPVAQV